MDAFGYVHANKRVRVGKAMIDLKRGQLAFATRFLADKWKWAHSKVVRFLNRLKTDTMVNTSATREATLITISNYNNPQFSNTTETQTGTQSDTLPEHTPNKEEETKQINDQKTGNAFRCAPTISREFRRSLLAGLPTQDRKTGGNEKTRDHQ